MLFSEPKIPQSCWWRWSAKRGRCFSALQRAENSSIRCADRPLRVIQRFQCSSASRKFLNASRSLIYLCDIGGFSALQRAENSSIVERFQLNPAHFRFQCSSASRKFLNTQAMSRTSSICRGFSALQRAENSSSGTDNRDGRGAEVSVLFSEPKIPQLRETKARLLVQAFQCSSASRKFLNCSGRLEHAPNTSVSVLFSEPKIPQLYGVAVMTDEQLKFQCSSASRKFLNAGWWVWGHNCWIGFQCSSASRKFLNLEIRVYPHDIVAVSVLFSEPKIPQ